MIKYFYFLSIILIFFSCKKENNYQDKRDGQFFKHAKNISVTEDKSTITLTTSSNSISFSKSELPLSNIMVETSSSVGFINELDALSTIKLVTEADYIYNQQIKEKILNKEIYEVGKGSDLNLELILKNKPQLVIANSNPVLAKYHKQLEEYGVKVLYLDEYKEKTPLSQAEYLLIFGKLLGKDSIANGIFNEVENKYLKIKNKAQSKKNKSITTFVNTMYGDVWYMPTANHIQTQLINDANGNYLFSDNLDTNTLNLSFEEVYLKAKDATYWINPSSYTTLAELDASYPHYKWFNAFKTGNVYNYTKRRNKNGANDYFEKGVVRPDLILRDLSKIFNSKTFLEDDLYFYNQLK